jgi:hypothetical protein
MDGAGVLYERDDPEEVAALIDLVAGDTALQERIVAGQDEALARLRAKDFGGTLLRFIEQVAASPRRPRPPVTVDFWQQFETTERLEYLRVMRPSLYKALPAASRASGINW